MKNEAEKKSVVEIDSLLHGFPQVGCDRISEFVVHIFLVLPRLDEDQIESNADI